MGGTRGSGGSRSGTGAGSGGSLGGGTGGSGSGACRLKQASGPRAAASAADIETGIETNLVNNQWERCADQQVLCHAAPGGKR